MKYYFFNYNSKSNGEGFTVIFDCWQELYPQELSRELKEFHTYNEQQKKTIYIFPNLPGRLSDSLQGELSDVVNKDSSDIIALSFDHYGFSGISAEVSISELYENGILNIVKLRNAVLESDDSYHYVLPSEKHSPFFIRTGNMLSNSEEVNFIALAILGVIKDKKINQISCDSSSILTIPYAVNYLLGLFNRTNHIPFSSFGSYSNVDDYEFLPRTLVLISASNSGRLLKKIISKQRDVDFITILFNGTEANDHYLINLQSHLPNLLNNSSQHKQFDSLKVCEYCKQNSIPVVVRGDQFMPSRMLIQKVLLAKPNVPSWVKASANSLIFCKSISAYRAENLTAKKRELFIDIEKALINNKDFESEFRKYIKNNVAASTSIIIHLPDKSSKFIAEQIASHLKSIGSNVKILEQADIRQLNPTEENLIMVVASCVTTGNKLNSISRDLREFNKASVHYLAVINRLADANKYEILRKNLEYRNGNDPNVNRFSSIFDCHLGDYHCNLFNEADKPSWETELSFWKDLKSQGTHVYINQRITELENKDGLQNNLFLPKPLEGENSQLKLRKNFAFHQIREHQLEHLTQADLYFIVAGVFHYLRNPKYIKVDAKHTGLEKFLVQHEHVKTIIDPVCFKRYNDGIIQAAILRIATNSELNYSVSDRDSLEMLETLKDIFKDSSDVNLSEALLEFLYAIACNKLRLQNYHLDVFLDFVDSKYSAISIAKILVAVCRERNHLILNNVLLPSSKEHN